VLDEEEAEAVVAGFINGRAIFFLTTATTAAGKSRPQRRGQSTGGIQT
jgi:hypothetical protein